MLTAQKTKSTIEAICSASASASMTTTFSSDFGIGSFMYQREPTASL